MKLRNFLLCTIILGALTLTIIPMTSATNSIKTDEPIQMVDSISYVNTIDIQKDSIKNMLITSVHNYISEYAPTMAPQVTNDMVEISLDKNFNLCFMLAQAQVETHFGRYGAGQSRKSIFGVNGTFSSYRECIEKYVDLIQNNYLGPNRTEQHLLQNYVTVRGGYRYAANENYEPHLKNVYNRILVNTNIRQLQNEFESL